MALRGDGTKEGVAAKSGWLLIGDSHCKRMVSQSAWSLGRQSHFGYLERHGLTVAQQSDYSVNPPQLHNDGRTSANS